MDFLQFKEELYETLLVYVKEQLNGTLHSDLIQKNGGPKNGFTYVQGNGPIGITLYAENAYEFYQNGASIDQIAKGMFNTMKEYSMDQDAEINIEEMFKPENIIPALVPSEGNEELLKTIPHIPFENLEIIFKFSLPNFRGGGTANVPNRYMELHGWNAEKLLDIAMKNSAYRDEISVMPLVDAMFGPSWMSWEEDLIFLSEVPGKSVIISNSSNAYGAAAIMDKEVMKKIADVFGEDLYIIPSSVHDCILMPKSESTLEELQEMVYEVNRETVSREDRLSDDIYFFDSITKEITMASGQREISKQQEPKVTGEQRR